MFQALIYSIHFYVYEYYHCIGIQYILYYSGHQGTNKLSSVYHAQCRRTSIDYNLDYSVFSFYCINTERCVDTQYVDRPEVETSVPNAKGASGLRTRSFVAFGICFQNAIFYSIIWGNICQILEADKRRIYIET